MERHGVYVSKNASNVSAPAVAESGIPFVIGTAPVQSAVSPATAGMPVLCKTWDEAVQKLGYSDDWANYSLCEFMYSHFKLFGCEPVIFCNLLDPSTTKAGISAADIPVIDKKITLPITAIDDAALVIKAAGDTGEAYVKDSDYSTYYSGENLIVEVLEDGTIYNAAGLSVKYNAVTPASVTAEAVATGLESIEWCMTMTGTVPDLICAPKFSSDTAVAAVMATKAAAGINGLFGAKALIDISADDDTGATTYDAAITMKAENSFSDENQIVCWPMIQLAGRRFHQSTQLAGLMAQVDTGNNGCPYESPSNKRYQCDSMVTASGKEINHTFPQANMLNGSGIVTALNFMGSWTCWGNTTACYPQSTEVKDYFIPVARMFDWVGNTLIRTFWNRLDKPMSRRLIDSVVDNCNIWLNGLVGAGYLLGGRVEFKEEENPLESLSQGIIKIHVYLAPPGPAQEIEFMLEYDAESVAASLLAA